MSDFYDQAARKQYSTLQAARARVLANLEEHKATGDDYSAQEELQTLATLNDQMASLERLHQQYNASLHPAPPPPPTEAEWHAKSAERMTPEDAVQVFAKSKYFPKDAASDPDFMNRYRQGVAEVQRRKAYESGR
jgi:hypothetical protein